ncbi:hypothetical protein SCLCIDRAFT_1211675 [Scleroderma citrinum Foug A]|uniref:Uncharacterized protein n=1 Tax=Scleroderma citrinum Foug A TaxID=1036808 RepID=A0A0C3AM36_9AGAM|nr:hypothetical protein SCLCIDRAFT_1211675 [Scleroderma citrinum Foug A]
MGLLRVATGPPEAHSSSYTFCSAGQVQKSVSHAQGIPDSLPDASSGYHTVTYHSSACFQFKKRRLASDFVG